MGESKVGTRLSQKGMRFLRWIESVMNNQLKKEGKKAKSFDLVACGCSKDCAFIRLNTTEDKNGKKIKS